MYNILYLIYWQHIGRCIFLLLQTFYCKYWSANIFVCMRDSIWRINCWVGLLGQRVNTITFLWFIRLSCSAKSWVKWQLHQFGLPGQHTESPNFNVHQLTRWKMGSPDTLKSAFIPFTLNEAEHLFMWLNRGSTLKELSRGMSGQLHTSSWWIHRTDPGAEMSSFLWGHPMAGVWSNGP